MGRGATKAAGNPWYNARLEAAKWNDKLYSRAGAAEMFDCSVDTIDRIENGLNKCMPVDMAVLMADKYNSPNLLNHYCLNECPIGCRHSISEEIVDIDRVTVKLLKRLKIDDLEGVKEKLLDIAEDGVIDSKELPDLTGVVDFLDDLAKTISELKTISQKVMNSGEYR